MKTWTEPAEQVFSFACPPVVVSHGNDSERRARRNPPSLVRRSHAPGCRLEAEGLGGFWQEEVCRRHLEDPGAWGLERVMQAIQSHQRRVELWQR